MYVMDKKILMVNILFKSRYSREKEILIQEKDGNLALSFAFATNRGVQCNEILSFRIDLYERKLKDISLYLKIIKKQEE